jgi:hypothetical protein
MSQANIRSISVTVALCITMICAMNVGAQQTFRDSIEQAQAQIQSGMRQILHEELLLSDEESEAFWPLYDEYRADLAGISDEYVSVVSEFVDRYQAGELDDEAADRLLDESLKIQLSVVEIRQDYVSRFREILSGVKVVRFYQLENKVQAEVDAALALAIPLADPS